MKSKDSIPFERLCIGMLVADEAGDEGRVQNLDDIHNVEIEYNNDGMGICCLDKDCKDYDPLFWVVADEYNSDIIDSLFIKQPNIEDFADSKEYTDALLVYIKRLKRDHEIEMEMLTSALEVDDKHINQLTEEVIEAEKIILHLKETYKDKGHGEKWLAKINKKL